MGINFKGPESASLIGDGGDFTTIREAGTRHPPNHPDTRPEDNLFHVDGRPVQRMALDYSGPFLEKSCAQGSHAAWATFNYWPRTSPAWWARARYRPSAGRPNGSWSPSTTWTTAWQRRCPPACLGRAPGAPAAR